MIPAKPVNTYCSLTRDGLDYLTWGFLDASGAYISVRITQQQANLYAKVLSEFAKGEVL